jgi:hypothetical protein
MRVEQPPPLCQVRVCGGCLFLLVTLLLEKKGENTSIISRKLHIKRTFKLTIKLNEITIKMNCAKGIEHSENFCEGYVRSI